MVPDLSGPELEGLPFSSYTEYFAFMHAALRLKKNILVPARNICHV